MNIPLASLTSLGGPDLLIILLIVLLLFGAKKLPDLAKGMGQAIKEFNKAKDSIHDEITSAGKPADAQTPQPPQQSVTQPPQIQTPPEQNAVTPTEQNTGTVFPIESPNHPPQQPPANPAN